MGCIIPVRPLLLREEMESSSQPVLVSSVIREMTRQETLEGS